MADPRDRLAEWVERADRAALPGLYAAVSIRPERVRAWLRAAGRPFVDPERGQRPSAAEVGRTAAWVIDQARVKGALVGAVAGLGGAASIPPEAAAAAIAALRLGQRLAVVHGFDPRTDRGAMATWQAVAAGFELPLPEDGPLGLRLSTVPRLVAASAEGVDPAGALATAVVRRSAWWAASRLSRWVPLPLISSGLGARSGERHLAEVGARMERTLARLAEAPIRREAAVDAVEVGRR